MHVKYTDDTGAVREWDFKPGRVRASEAQVLERVFGDDWDTLAGGIQSGSMRARMVLLWHLFRRDGNTLRFEDMPDIYADQLKVEYSVDELTEMRANIEKASTLSADKREAVLAAIDRQMADAMEREGALAEGKASSRTPSTGGGSSSPQSSTSLPGESAI